MNNSTGPKTTNGKSRSRMNALKHGLRATDELFLCCLSENEREVFNDLRTSLHREFKPTNTQEKLLVDEIAIQHFRLFRLYSIEHVAATISLNDPLKRESIVPHLDRFSRYDWRIGRQLRSLQNRLKMLYNHRNDLSVSSFSLKE